MKTREILTIIALSVLGLILILYIVTRLVKSSSMKVKLTHTSSFLIIIAVVLLAISQFISETQESMEEDSCRSKGMYCNYKEGKGDCKKGAYCSIEPWNGSEPEPEHKIPCDCNTEPTSGPICSKCNSPQGPTSYCCKAIDNTQEKHKKICEKINDQTTCNEYTEGFGNYCKWDCPCTDNRECNVPGQVCGGIKDGKNKGQCIIRQHCNTLNPFHPYQECLDKNVVPPPPASTSFVDQVCSDDLDNKYHPPVCLPK